MPPEPGTLTAAKPKPEGFKDWLRIFFCGLCMGAADIVPGISGGTVAFILGIYGDLLDSIKSFNFTALALLLRFRFREFFEKTSWKFLAALLSGILVSMISLAQFIDYVLGHEVYRVLLYSGFLGLILASVIFCAKQLKRWKPFHFASLLTGAAIAYMLTGNTLTPSIKEALYDVDISKVSLQNPAFSRLIQNYNQDTRMLLAVPESTLAAMLAKGIVEPGTRGYNRDLDLYGPVGFFVHPQFTIGIDFWVLCCGMIAISAMLLPGISGSYLLTILGMYAVVIGALADFIHGVRELRFEAEAFYILLSMLMGILTGAVLFSHAVSWLLRKFHDMTIAALTGFMVGALGSVWPFWSYVYVLSPLKLAKGPQLQIAEPLVPAFNSPWVFISILFCLFGFALVFLVEYLASKKSQH